MKKIIVGIFLILLIDLPTFAQAKVDLPEAAYNANVKSRPSSVIVNQSGSGYEVTFSCNKWPGNKFMGVLRVDLGPGFYMVSTDVYSGGTDPKTGKPYCGSKLITIRGEWPKVNGSYVRPLMITAEIDLQTQSQNKENASGGLITAISMDGGKP